MSARFCVPEDSGRHSGRLPQQQPLHKPSRAFVKPLAAHHTVARRIGRVLNRAEGITFAPVMTIFPLTKVRITTFGTSIR